MKQKKSHFWGCSSLMRPDCKVWNRAEKTKSMQEIRSSMAAAKLLREGIKEKQSKLQSVTAKKVKLLESRLNKK
jgi:hypothetical protein